MRLGNLCDCAFHSRRDIRKHSRQRALALCWMCIYGHVECNIMDMGGSRNACGVYGCLGQLWNAIVMFLCFYFLIRSVKYQRGVPCWHNCRKHLFVVKVGDNIVYRIHEAYFHLP